jgi:hypothetical protein
MSFSITVQRFFLTNGNPSMTGMSFHGVHENPEIKRHILGCFPSISTLWTTGVFLEGYVRCQCGEYTSIHWFVQADTTR